jgi:hypothetical protein
MGTTSTSTSPSRAPSALLRVLRASRGLSRTCLPLVVAAFSLAVPRFGEAQESPFRPRSQSVDRSMADPVPACPGTVADDWNCSGTRCTARTEAGGRIVVGLVTYNARAVDCSEDAIRLVDVVWLDPHGLPRAAAELVPEPQDPADRSASAVPDPVRRRAGLRSASAGARPGTEPLAQRVVTRADVLLPLERFALSLGAEAAPSGLAGTVALEDRDARTLRFDAGRIGGRDRWMLAGSARLTGRVARAWIDADRAGRSSRPYFAGSSSTSLLGGEFAELGVAMHHGPLWARLVVSDQQRQARAGAITTAVDADVGVLLRDGALAWSIETAAQHRTERVVGATDNSGVGVTTRASGSVSGQRGALAAAAGVAIHTTAWSERRPDDVALAPEQGTESATAIVPSVDLGVRSTHAEWSTWVAAPLSVLSARTSDVSPWSAPGSAVAGSSRLSLSPALGPRVFGRWTSVGRVAVGGQPHFAHQVYVGSDALAAWVAFTHSTTGWSGLLAGVEVRSDVVAWRLIGDTRQSVVSQERVVHGEAPLRRDVTPSRGGSGLRSEWVARLSSVHGAVAVDLWDDRGAALGYGVRIGWDAPGRAWGLSLESGQPVGQSEPYAVLRLRTGRHPDAWLRGLRSPIHLY